MKTTSQPHGQQTVAQAIAEALARHGVEVLFSQSLPSALVMAAEDIGIRQYTYRTENAGAAMADGYARVTAKAAVVTAQNGPAATLLVPGLAEALKSSVPVVALVQDVNLDHTDRNAFQDLDHFALFSGCTKWMRKISEPSRAIDYVDMAFAAATGGRPGPVVLMLPPDLLLKPMPKVMSRRANLGACPLDRSVPEWKKIAEAANLIKSSKHPLIVAGGGVHTSGAAQAVADLQDGAGIPVATTVMGKGAVDERHPLSLGVAGNLLGRMSTSHHGAPRIHKADVVLLLGTRTAQNGTDSWAMFSPDAQFIHVDIDPSEIGRNYEALRLVGDVRETTLALSTALAGWSANRSEDETFIAKARVRHSADIADIAKSKQAPVRPEFLMAEMATLLTKESIVVADASYSSVWISSYLQALAPGMRFLTPRGLAGLGWGLPLAMGAKHAHPDKTVFAVVGDGGFAHVWSELETCVRTKTAVVLTVLNNGILGFQKDAENVKFGRHTGACYFAPVDHAAIARAAGARGVQIEKAEDYLPALREAIASNEVTVLDVITDPQAYPPITQFDGLEDLRRELSNTGRAI